MCWASLWESFQLTLVYSESPSISPELVADVILLSGLEGILGVTVVPSVGCEQFEFLFLLLIAVVVAVLGVAVLVSVLAVRTAPTQYSKAGHSTPSVMMGGVNAGSSG